RLFISMRMGASVSQLLAEMRSPRGARTVRALAKRDDIAGLSSSRPAKIDDPSGQRSSRFWHSLDNVNAVDDRLGIDRLELGRMNKLVAEPWHCLPVDHRAHVLNDLAHRPAADRVAPVAQPDRRLVMQANVDG